MVNSDLVKGIVIGFVGVLILFGIGILIWRNFNKSPETIEPKRQADILMQALQNIAKLMVVETQVSEVYTYEDHQKTFFNLISTEKKAILILKAKVQIGYDLRKMEYQIDTQNRILNIIHIPKEEINITPEIKYYDMKNSIWTSFSPEDMTKIQADAIQRIHQAVETSQAKEIAKHQLTTQIYSLFPMMHGTTWKIIDKTQTLSLPKFNF
ncbi:MAG: DUF4230 domain-containing protein [Chitinophagales bacterium]|jgi:hypothetical protein|nr:DUF4230 domain-containing protein [Chitinophagales bacterium]